MNDTIELVGGDYFFGRKRMVFRKIEPSKSGGIMLTIHCKERHELTADEIANTFSLLGLDEEGRQRMAELRKLGETPPEPPQRVVTTDNTTEDAIDHE